MVEFKPDQAWRGPGAPPIEIPPLVQQWADQTYRDNTVWENPADPDHQDTKDLIRLLDIYAKRQDRRLHHQFFTGPDGRTYLRFKMRDKRPYRRTDGLPRTMG